MRRSLLADDPGPIMTVADHQAEITAQNSTPAPPAPPAKREREPGAKSFAEWEAEEAAAATARNQQADNLTANNTRAPGAQFQQLNLSYIYPSDFNPRTEFEGAALTELAESIREHGLMEPLVVWCENSGFNPRYTIIAGERRYRASKLVGLAHVPAMVHYELTRAQAIALALTENLIRRDINSMEMARGIKLLTDAGHTQQEIARMINRSQPVVANTLGLLQLPADVQQRIARGELSAAHGQALRKYSDVPIFASRLAEDAAKNKTSSGDLEGSPHANWIMQNRGLVAHLEGNYETTTLFDWKAICPTNCPFNAYREPHFCLNPEHYKKLNQEAQQALANKHQAAAASGATIPKLFDLPVGSYMRIGSTPPRGCTADCPCRSVCTTENFRGQEEVVPICTDGPRYKKLQATETRDKTKAKKAEAAETLTRVINRINGPPNPVTIDRSVLTLLTVRILISAQPAAANIAAQAHGFSDLVDKKNSWVRQHGQDKLLDALVGRDAVAAAKMAAEAMLRKDLSDLVDFGSKPELVKWFLKQPSGIHDLTEQPAPAIPTSDTDREELLAMAEKHSAAQQKISEMHRELSTAQRNWDDLKIRHDQAHAKNQNLRNEAASIHRQMTDSREEVSRLKTEAVALRTEMNALRRQAAPAPPARDRVAGFLDALETSYDDTRRSAPDGLTQITAPDGSEVRP